MQHLFLLVFGCAVLAVLLSSLYLYLFCNRGDRERLPERIGWYLGISVLFFFVLTYGERANEPVQNLQMIFGIYVLLSVALTVLQTVPAVKNNLKHLAKSMVYGNRHQQSDRQPVVATDERESPTAQVMPLDPPKLVANG